MRARAIPIVGGRVTVAFLGTKAHGAITAVDPDQRGLTVVTDDGDQIRFELSAATGRFAAVGTSRARLFFE